MARGMMLNQLEKARTGIQGLDEITNGGLPRGRPTLVCGGPGSGKTLLGMEFLVRGATQYNEPGVFMSFEETADELTTNAASLGFNLKRLAGGKKVLVDYVHIERSEIEETGEYDLEGLFIRLDHAIKSIGAKRVVLDTIESIFSGLPNPLVLRSELRRLFRWLKAKGMTTVITGERGDDTLTRQGLEEYVSDCVIVLDHRVNNQISTRRMRIVKYRGATHGTNEYPFLIGEDGMHVLPITSVGLRHVATSETISSGIPRLDTMLGGKGFFRGSSVLISGTAGTGKTSIASEFTRAACRRGERCLYFAFEESPSQIIRNMRSIGIDLETWVKKGLLKFHAERSTAHGLEAHLAAMHKAVSDFKPKNVIVDPVTNLHSAGLEPDIKAMVTRLLDHMKSEHITTLFTSLTSAGSAPEESSVGISSLADAWLLLRVIELGGERNRAMYILKTRGMAHSNQIREFLLTDHGVDLVNAYVGPTGVLTGSARLSQEAQEKAQELEKEREVERRRRNLESKQKALETQMASLRTELETAKEELRETLKEEKLRKKRAADERKEISEKRKAD